MIAAADELDAAVAGLDGGEVAVVLGTGVAEQEHVAVDAVHGALFAAGSDESLVGPGFAVVEGDRGEEAGAVEVAVLALEGHAVGFAGIGGEIGEGTEEQRTFAQADERLALHAADGGKLGGLMCPALATIAGEAGRCFEVEGLLLGFAVEAAEGHQAAVVQLDHWRVDARVTCSAAVAMRELLVGDGFGGPGLAAIGAFGEAGGGDVLRHPYRAVAAAHELVSDLAPRLDDLRLAPGDAVVGAVAHDVFTQAAHEVEERLVAIPPEFRRVVIHVRAVPKERCRLPFARAEAQTAGEVVQLRAGLIDAGIPHREQIAVRTFGDGGAVIVPCERRAKGVRLHFDEGLRSFKNRYIRVHPLDLRRAL